jgi:ABC-type branched-subunit amino acid transport system substrate-binding protein
MQPGNKLTQSQRKPPALRARSAALALTAVAALGLAACSSSSSGGATTSPASSTGAGSSTAAAAAASGAAGTTYKLVSVQDEAGSNAQLVQDGTTAAIDSINAAGGIDGHPIALSFCNTTNDPNVAAQCARTGVSDPSVVAFTSNSTSYSANVDAVLVQAGVPLIGGIPFSQGDFTSKIAFNTSPGALGTPAQGIMIIKQLKGSKIGVPYVDVPAGAGIKPLMQAIAGPLGGTVVGNVPIPISAADVTTEAAAVQAADPDGIVDALLTPQMVSFIKAYRQQGGTTPFVVGTNELGSMTIQQQLAGASQNIYATAWFNYQSSGYKQYRADMAKYQPKALDPTNDLTADAWLNIELFAMAAEKTLKASPNTPLSRAGLLKTMNTWTDFNLGNMTPTLDFSKPQTALGGGFSRIVDPYYYPVQYKNGQFVSMNNETPVNLFAG